MPDDRSYTHANTRQRERLRALVNGLDDETLATPVKRVLDGLQRARRQSAGATCPEASISKFS